MFDRFCFCLYLWCLVGVFGDERKSVSVKEGDSVTLNFDLTEIHNDLIQWSFSVENTLIAEINVTADRFSVFDDVLDGRFRDRLKLDKQTGSLTITNFTNEHSGLYTVETKNMNISFFLAVYEEISVKKGDSVTLNSDLTEIDYDLILWTYLYMSEKSGILKPTNRMTVNEDALDGRFRDRLKLDNQTGSLTITNIRNEHTGDYELLIIGAKQSLKVFSVSVYDSVHCCGSTEAVIRLVLSALVGVATVIFLVYDIRSRRAEQDQTQIHTTRESVCHGQLKSTEFFSEQDSNPGHQHGRVMGPSPPCRGLVLLDPLQARSEPGSLGREEGTLTRTLSTAAASINSYKQASDTL